MQILMYHSVGRHPDDYLSVAPEAFRRQMEWLAERGRGQETLSQALARPDRPRESVVVTFDDAYADNYEEAFPILKEFGLTATIFAIPGAMGRRPDWTDAHPVAPLLDWGQVREMSQAGFEFGSHTMTHLDVCAAPLAQVAEELSRSKVLLEEQLGQAITSFAYPYGYFREEMPHLLNAAGYRWAVLADTYGYNTARTDPYQLRRVPIEGSDSLEVFARKARGWYNWWYYPKKVRNEARFQVKMLQKRLSRGH
ncbi:MAG TPA: polysaccharide deacetylase family protein [Armatimonadota bacterium]|jgi:peptidoglycan/xylan/chitin deacetylase (PgdA/CDA1 family)